MVREKMTVTLFPAAVTIVTPTKHLLANTDDSNAWWWGEAEGKRTDDAALTEQFTSLVSRGISFHVHANGTGAIQQFL